jgi:hypothetical protein
MHRENLSLGALVRRWGFAVLWATLPFTAGPALADCLDSRSPLFRSTVSVGLWLAWAITLGVALVPRTVTLTVLRIVTPAAVVAVVWSAAATPSLGIDDVIAVIVTAVAAVVMFAPAIGDEYVNGSSYGDERRFPLRAPGALLLGPIELTWLLVIAGAVAGPLLLASKAWVAGGIALVVGWPVAWFGSRALHMLSRRWLVLTPAGVVLHDQLSVVEAMLVLRNQVAAIRPALIDSPAKDLTQGSPGLALEIAIVDPLSISLTPVRHLRQPGTVVSEDVTAVLFTPSRPGVVLREAAARRLPVG